jgi:CubicO group peptidase (beta-lactamase class C family)
MDRQYSVFSRLSKWHFRAGFWAIALALMAGTCSAQAPAERMQQVVQPFADAQMFMGSVLVAHHGKVLFSKSYGSADLE